MELKQVLTYLNLADCVERKDWLTLKECGHVVKILNTRLQTPEYRAILDINKNILGRFEMQMFGERVWETIRNVNIKTTKTKFEPCIEAITGYELSKEQEIFIRD